MVATKLCVLHALECCQCELLSLASVAPQVCLCVCTKLVGPRCTKLAHQTVLCEDARSGVSCVHMVYLVNIVYLISTVHLVYTWCISGVYDLSCVPNWLEPCATQVYQVDTLNVLCKENPFNLVYWAHIYMGYMVCSKLFGPRCTQVYQNAHRMCRAQCGVHPLLRFPSEPKFPQMCSSLMAGQSSGPPQRPTTNFACVV